MEWPDGKLFLDGSFNGGTLTFEFTSASTFRAEGNGHALEGTVSFEGQGSWVLTNFQWNDPQVGVDHTECLNLVKFENVAGKEADTFELGVLNCSRLGIPSSNATANAVSGRPGADLQLATGLKPVFATGPNPLFQNPLWWFGTPNPTPPPAIVTTTFEPLSGLPGWSQPYAGWFRDLDFEACVLGVGTVLGATTVVGPYGTSTNSISTSGC